MVSVNDAVFAKDLNGFLADKILRGNQRQPVARFVNIDLSAKAKRDAERRNKTLLRVSELPTEEELDSINFELEAQNAVETADSNVLIYSFEFRKKEYTFAIGEMKEQDRYGKRDYVLMGFILGKIMPIDVQLFCVPEISRTHARSFEQAEIIFYDKVYDLLQEGRLGELTVLKVQYKEVIYDKNGSLAFKRNSLYQAENLRVGGESFKQYVGDCLKDDDFSSYKKKVGEDFVEDVANRLIRSWYKMRDNYYCNIQKDLFKEEILEGFKTKTDASKPDEIINVPIVPLGTAQSKIQARKQKLARRKAKRIRKEFSEISIF